MRTAFAAALVALHASRALAGPVAYVANYYSGELSVIDAAAHQNRGSVEIGGFPAAVVFSPTGRFAYVARAAGEAEMQGVVAVDVQTGTIINTVPAGEGPSALALSADGRVLYVANAGHAFTSDGTISVLDTRAVRGSTDPLLATVPVGGDPMGLAVSPDGGVVYATNALFAPDNVLALIDAPTALSDPEHAVVDRITVGNAPLGIAVTQDGHYAYVANSAFGSNVVSVVDLSAHEAMGTIAVGSRPTGVAISPNGGFVYVTNLISDTVSVIAVTNNRVRRTLDVGHAPYAVAFAPDGSFAYVANRQSLTVPTLGTVSIIDTARALSSPTTAVIGSVEVGENPVAVAIADDPLTALLGVLFSDVVAEDADFNLDDRANAGDLIGWQQAQARTPAPPS